MWSEFEARIEENEKDRPNPLRRELFEILHRSTLRAGHGGNKKMLSFEFASKERLLWEIEGSARNFFLSQRWQRLVEPVGFSCELRPYQKGLVDGARHSALSREWSFGDDDCVVLQGETAEEMQRLLDCLLQPATELLLDPVAVTRWISRLRHFFPALRKFNTPDPAFDAQERDYKLEIARKLKAALEGASSDQEIEHAIHSALTKSNLLEWRVYWPISPKGDADREKVRPALRKLVNAAFGDPIGHADALEEFCAVWAGAAPKSTQDSARQIAEFLFLHLAPSAGIYLRHSVRRDFWLEAVGSRFPDHDSAAETYRDEQRFMHAVRTAFEENGLAPRDMIDVQSALWVIHNYKDEEEGDNLLPFLKREVVEAAMDAYEAYLQTGEHGEIFGSFGEPRDYWVRSTRLRSAQVFPTKPLIGFIRIKSELNGGWAQKGDAAVQLHNSGFIVVNKDNAPVEPPEQYDHLIRDADRIRLCALNYYIEPAREKREARVSIRAGTLASDLFLENRMRNVCQALKGEKLQTLADVLPPKQLGPDDSTNTTFDFELFDQEDLPTMETNELTQRHTATNTILYGPPGTGKTFSTAQLAVEICDGKSFGDRTAVMTRYNQIRDSGQIAFTTFHQSYSYEEFVEGLRPETDDGLGSNEPPADPKGAGFRLEPKPGIFRELVTLADEARKRGRRGGGFDLSGRQIFKMSLGRAGSEEHIFEAAINGNYVVLGWGGKTDWSASEFDGEGGYDEISARWNKDHPGTSPHDSNIVQTWRFRTSMQVGDLVVISEGNSQFRAIAEIVGPYEFVADEKSAYVHRRAVRWLVVFDDSLPVEAIYEKAFSQKSCYLLKDKFLKRSVLARLLSEDEGNAGESDQFVLIIDEINRANISKVFGELITLLEADKRLGAENELMVRLP